MNTSVMIFLGAGCLLAGVSAFAAEREPSPELLARALQRYPDADLDKDGKLTLEGFREFRRKRQTARPTATTTDAPPGANPQGRDPAVVRITDDPKMPRVLLIGDSISVG